MNFPGCSYKKRQTDEREQDFTIRREARDSVVLLKRFKTESQKGLQSLECPVSQCVGLPAVLSGDAEKTFLINTHERKAVSEREKEEQRIERERDGSERETKTEAGRMKSEVIKLNYYQS